MRIFAYMLFLSALPVVASGAAEPLSIAQENTSIASASPASPLAQDGKRANAVIKLRQHDGQDAQRVMQRIAALRNDNDLGGLKLLFLQLPGQWAGDIGKQQDYFRILHSLCFAVAGHDYGVRRLEEQQELATNIALTALQFGDKLPLRYQTDLLRCIQSELERNRGRMQEEQWGKVRLERVSQWLRPWQRIAAERIPGYDPNAPQNVTTMNVAPPVPPSIAEGMATTEVKGKDIRGWILLSGMDPKDIADPQIRTAYTAAIKENTAKIERNSRQNELRQIDAEFSPLAERYIIEAYSRKPEAGEELANLLRKADIDAERSKRILAGVSQAIQEANKAPQNQPR